MQNASPSQLLRPEVSSRPGGPTIAPCTPNRQVSRSPSIPPSSPRFSSIHHIFHFPILRPASPLPIRLFIFPTRRGGVWGVSASKKESLCWRTWTCESACIVIVGERLRCPPFPSTIATVTNQLLRLAPVEQSIHHHFNFALTLSRVGFAGASK